jgi:diaminopimelate epimerase
MVASAPVAHRPAVTAIPFFKMTGSGNDFVMLDGRFNSADEWTPAQVRAICDRRNGVGADGLVILTPAAGGMVRMIYWNSDGSRSAMCGNAALCSGRLALHLELVSAAEFCLLTDAGVVRVKSLDDDTAEISLPDFEAPGEASGIELGPGELWMDRLTAGVPHLVVRVDDVKRVDVLGRGRLLRFDQTLGSDGANVNFVSPPLEPDGSWLIRTYERGVEGETLACGTGTVAAAVALACRGEARLPMRLRSRGGLELSVRARLGGTRATDVWLGGEGRLVFQGVWGADRRTGG